MLNPTIKYRNFLTALALTSLLIGQSYAQNDSANYPNKPIKFVVPYPAGAGNDLLARLLGQKMSENFKQPVIVENRPGAAGNIGLDYVARAQPDGYTIAIADTGPLAINTTLYPKLTYQPLKDLTAIASLVTFQYLLVINPSLPIDSVSQLIEYAKAQPGKLNYASVGNGSVVHLATELFKTKAAINLTHVPYKASPEALQSVMAGETQIMFVNVQASAPLLKAGKLRALAIVDAARSASFPELKTMAEAGVPDFAFKAWFGIVAPAKVPLPIVRTLNQEFNRLLQLPEVQERFKTMGGIQVLSGTPQEFSDLIKADTDSWGKLVRQTGAKVE